MTEHIPAEEALKEIDERLNTPGIKIEKEAGFLIDDIYHALLDMNQRLRALEDLLHSQADENDVAAKEAEAMGEIDG